MWYVFISQIFVHAVRLCTVHNSRHLAVERLLAVCTIYSVLSDRELVGSVRADTEAEAAVVSIVTMIGMFDSKYCHLALL